MALVSRRFRGNLALQAAACNKPPLAWGARGSGVYALQKALVDLGYPMPISLRKFGRPDGIYGRETAGVVARFQTEQRLHRDSVAGHDTLHYLDHFFDEAVPGRTAAAGSEPVDAAAAPTPEVPQLADVLDSGIAVGESEVVPLSFAGGSGQQAERPVLVLDPIVLDLDAAIVVAVNVAEMSFEERLGLTLQKSIPLLPDEAQKHVMAMLQPEALATISAVLVIWAGSHFFGVGEIADVVLIILAFVSIGMVAFDVAEELFAFASGVDDARTEADLEIAAQHFANAVALAGITAILAVLFKARPKGTFKSGNLAGKVKAPAPTGKFRYKPMTTANPGLGSGRGFTTMWGDVVYSSQGAKDIQRLVKLHEKVHQILTPKLYLLREYRVRLRINGYNRSYILRYLEEALAETVAQVGVNGIRGVIDGIRFPLNGGYRMTLTNLATEAAGILLGPVSVGGMSFNAYLSKGD